jgi:RNA polymerase sigma factor (sigma-70 family)
MAQPQYTPTCALTQLRHPPPFHPDQLRHAQQGCPDCLDHLMAQNDALVHWVIRRYGSAPLDYDEALQTGRIGLWQALLHFNPAHGTAFSSYAVPAILRHIRREAHCARRFWQPRPDRSWAEPPDPVQEAERNGLRQAVHRWVGQLPHRQILVLRARYGLDGARPQDQKAIAAPLGVTRQRVTQLLQEAHLRLALPLYSWEVRRWLQRTAAPELRAALRAWYHFRARRRR